MQVTEETNQQLLEKKFNNIVNSEYQFGIKYRIMADDQFKCICGKIGIKNLSDPNPIMDLEEINRTISNQIGLHHALVIFPMNHLTPFKPKKQFTYKDTQHFKFLIDYAIRSVEFITESYTFIYELNDLDMKELAKDSEIQHLIESLPSKMNVKNKYMEAICDIFNQISETYMMKTFITDDYFPSAKWIGGFREDSYSQKFPNRKIFVVYIVRKANKPINDQFIRQYANFSKNILIESYNSKSIDILHDREVILMRYNREEREKFIEYEISDKTNYKA